MVNYECITCNYITNKKSNYVKHMATRLHLKKSTLIESNPLDSNKNPNESINFMSPHLSFQSKKSLIDL